MKLDTATIEFLMKSNKVLHFKKNEVIIRSGNINQNIYLLVSGDLGIFSQNELIAKIDTAFEFVGEMSYISGQNSKNDVIALTDISLVVLENSFIKANYSQILPIICLQLVQKLQNTNKKAYLYELANKELQKTQKVLESASFKKIEDSAKNYQNILMILMDVLENDFAKLKSLNKETLTQILPAENKIKNITNRLSEDFSLSQQKILLIDDQPQTQIQTKMALGGTGAKLFFAQTIEESLTLSEKNKFDFIFFSDAFLDTIQQLEKNQKNTNFVFITNQAMTEFYEKVKNNLKIETIISKHPDDQTFTIKNIMTTVQKISQQNIFGFEKYLHWGTHIREKWVTSSKERAGFIEEMEAYFQELGIRGTLLRKIGRVAEEFLMNAIYDAPCDSNQKPTYNHLQRTVEVNLKTEEYAQFRYACDGSMIAISVQDPFGSLKRETIFDYLNRNFNDQGNPDIQDKNKGGGGRGIFEAIQSSSLVVFNIDPLKKTEVIALFNTSIQTKKISLHPSFHYFEKKNRSKKQKNVA